MQVAPLPGGAALDALPQIFLAGGDVAFKDLVQGNAAEAQADDFVGHLQEQREVFRWLQFFLLLLICLLFPPPLISPLSFPQLLPKAPHCAPPLLPHSSPAVLLLSSSSSVDATSSTLFTSSSSSTFT